jgi:tubulin-specific chaperone D
VPVIQDVATSAVVGTEGLVWASRSAIAEYINMQDVGEQKYRFRVFIDHLIIILENNLLMTVTRFQQLNYPVSCLTYIGH